mmetsp:Transcript_37751/g.107860  ORF Transcript_37751/g.107860 Transcript_37751/m.107860 type:complete len:209 (-) Transcript_37751:2929-3555(-)
MLLMPCGSSSATRLRPSSVSGQVGVGTSWTVIASSGASFTHEFLSCRPNSGGCGAKGWPSVPKLGAGVGSVLATRASSPSGASLAASAFWGESSTGGEVGAAVPCVSTAASASSSSPRPATVRASDFTASSSTADCVCTSTAGVGWASAWPTGVTSASSRAAGASGSVNLPSSVVVLSSVSALLRASVSGLGPARSPLLCSTSGTGAG